VEALQHSYFTWYDNVRGANWLLVANANPLALVSQNQVQNITAALAIASLPVPLPSSGSLSAGMVPPGSLLISRYPGVVGGPVDVLHDSGDAGVISQRILWGGSSLEEVVAVPGQELSSHYLWTWYDMLSPGFEDWVLVANPGIEPVFYEISFGGRALESGRIGAGETVTPTFAGLMGGPLELRSWSDAERTLPAQVIASQRVLLNGTAFNEVRGTPVEKLSDRYLWTWYDMEAPGSQDWVLISNTNQQPVYYELRLAGRLLAAGDLSPGESVTPAFAGARGGPLELQAWSAADKKQPANVLASQRLVWGPSFEEVPGTPVSSLGASYGWTWYDMKSAGMQDWLTMANPGDTTIFFDIDIGGHSFASGILAAGEVKTPTLPGLMGGPVTLRAWRDAAKSVPAPVMASQRVLYRGFINEVTGSPIGQIARTAFDYPAAAAGAQPGTTTDIKAFGAAGDGVTDDTAAIQRAVDSGADVFVPAGRFRITDTITLANSQKRITGLGADSVIFADMDKNAIEFTGDHGYVGDLTIVGNSNPVAPVDGRTAIKFFDATDCAAENISIRDVNTGGIGTGGFSGSSRIVIRNVSVDHVREHGVYISNSHDILLEGVRVSGAGRNGGLAGTGLKIADSTGVRAYDVVSTGSLSAGVIAEAAADGRMAGDIDLINVTGLAPEPGQYGLYLNRNVSDVLVSGGRYEGDYGVRLNGSAGNLPHGVTLTGVEVRGVGQPALDVIWGDVIFLLGGSYRSPGPYVFRAGANAGKIEVLGAAAGPEPQL
jgi:hypothetical protein